MIHTLRIHNFKCFDVLPLPLGSLTLLTGFNATGKSTALQTLLLLAQAQRQGGRLPFVPLNGQLAHLGTPGDVLRDGSEPEMSLGVDTERGCVTWCLAPDDRRGTHALPISKIEWRVGQNVEARTAFSDGLENLLPRDAPEVIREIATGLAELVYLSATRVGTTEVFPAPEISEPVWADVGAQGEYAPWWFEKHLDEEIDVERRCPDESAPIFRRQLNAWASRLFPRAEANGQRLVGTSLVRLELRNHEADEWRRPANIGYGLTYAFPILVAGLVAKRGQLLVIDSPEAHLHPMGQSLIGRFLAMLANSGVQVIVETHSDHLVNGVRLAVNRGELAAKDAVIHFFNFRPRSPSDPAQLVSPTIDPSGNLSEWPPGFFDQAEQDLSALAGWSKA
jgi:predicted ATPase